MEPVGFATLYLKPRPVGDLGNVTPLWYGDALTPTGDVRLYVKQAPPGEILAECLCAVLGSALGLPVPRVFLVHDPAAWIGSRLLVGSEDAGMPSLRHHLDRAAPGLTAALAAWPQLHTVALFDEWIANPDRNQGNLLWDAADQWLLIDHARALGAWPPGAPVPDPEHPEVNQLAAVVLALEGDLGPQRLRKHAAPFGATCRKIDPQQTLEAARCHTLGMVERAAHTLSFLERRIDCLPALLARHGRQGELNL
jgi:hypothetical protein